MELTVIDAGDAHHAAASDAVLTVLARGDRLALPASAYAETLVSPNRRGGEAVATVDAFVDVLPVTVEPTTRAIGAQAAALRARHGARLR